MVLVQSYPIFVTNCAIYFTGPYFLSSLADKYCVIIWHSTSLKLLGMSDGSGIISSKISSDTILSILPFKDLIL